MRTITYAEGIREALDEALGADKRVFVIGEGVPDPKGVFGTTIGLQQKYGKERVMDMPISENGMTGVCIGAALMGMRPVLVHQRLDFSLYSFDQIVNSAAKWHSMFGGHEFVPLVIRMVVGRGWGQGAQHSQSLQALFAHIPGLTVVMPATATDAKGLLLSSIAYQHPVIFIEHRWLHGLKDEVPEKMKPVPLGAARIVRKGSDVTIVAASYMVIEAVRACAVLETAGISAELIDLRTIAPYDAKTIKDSVAKTRRLIVADTGVAAFGVSAEIIAGVAETHAMKLRAAPVRVALPFLPTPTSWHLAKDYYPTHRTIIGNVFDMLGKKTEEKRAVLAGLPPADPRMDVPDPSFTGPF